MEPLQQIQQKYLEELKALAQKLQQVQSFNGLMLYQSDIQQIYENFILLKTLNNNKILQQEVIQNLSNPPSTTTTIEFPDPPPSKPIETVEVITPIEKTSDPQNKLDFDFNINTTATYKKIQIDVNDSIAFQKKLFKGNKNDFDEFIEILNNRGKEASASYINHYKEMLHWGRKEEEYLNRLIELNTHRFD